ncbi:hypothetical protein AMTR_s00110p00133640 [Amborella trichopoda]|uniref:K+ potassium transporter integral membrane domain-containing protein n=1 Tax=Amborella trichopoda TaxID=13333 RepID=W1NXB1_AMBTC|nr:hypothetical protein AMTR_s00110p00133640 [Amborella trichopoda]
MISCQTKRFDSEQWRILAIQGQEDLGEELKGSSFLTFIVLLGTYMVIDDGVLTPVIFVLSAGKGIESRSPKINTNDVATGAPWQLGSPDTARSIILCKEKLTYITALILVLVLMICKWKIRIPN